METNSHEHGAHNLHAAFRKASKNLSLESYLSVLASGNYNALTVRQLNQILSIHGFKHLNKKHEVIEAISAMELKNFSRSTLGECIHPAPMSLTDVVKDLTQLNWQTCPVISVRSISATHDNNMASSTCKQKIPGPSGRSGEQASLVVSARSIYSTDDKNMASTCNPMVTIALSTEPASKQKSCGQSGRSVSSGGDNSSDGGDHGAVMIGTSCSSSTMVEDKSPSHKRKRMVKKKSPTHLLSMEASQT